MACPLRAATFVILKGGFCDSLTIPSEGVEEKTRRTAEKTHAGSVGYRTTVGVLKGWIYKTALIGAGALVNGGILVTAGHDESTQLEDFVFGETIEQASWHERKVGFAALFDFVRRENRRLTIG